MTPNKNLAKDLIESAKSIESMKKKLEIEKDNNLAIRKELLKKIDTLLNTPRYLELKAFPEKIRISRIKNPLNKTELENIATTLDLNNYTFYHSDKDISIEFYNDREAL